MSKVINISNLKPGKTYKVSVRGNLSNGKKTTWSQNYTITTPSDTAPATPAVPTVSVIGPQKVLVTHDNKDSTGALLSDTNKLFEVYMSSTNSNSAGTLIGTVPAQKPIYDQATLSFVAGISASTIAVNGPTTDATKYFYVKAVNLSGQRSASSATTSSVSITTFDSAYIGSLTADKIVTGILSAGNYISVGPNIPIVLKANAAAPNGQIYIGTGTYNNSNTPFYVDSDGKFSLKDKLTWDGTNLSITGAITATSGSFSGSITAGSTITGATLKTGSGSNYIEISEQSDGAYGSFGKIIFTTSSTYDGGIYASSGVDSPGIVSPHIIIESPKENSSYTSRITIVGDNDGYIRFDAGGSYVVLDSDSGIMKLIHSGTVGLTLDKTGFRNVYVSSTAGNPSPTSPQNGDIKLEW
ncbi:hypothetical protein UFOVP1491_100 [uncultured Caudovirales phage]|uniref:Fibronectin type-III domain-containing protein n=1 Tax=uncultured Caudovirales phage TaxID=2100421 RepID=A0A6J5N1E0_9CAUD|nr:hypothetical protein UFOVP485_21 [uncultured Caudovirales phage]CAB4151063.1 hypothetical protein UFOVP575_125 [uncultured Caudovirales phage]CAB4174261.1 hypothetical protein UFOVP963_35 [uncultured Caudovirales phage]CAB4179791.1 hypothetical protein UFOVP1032_100 [uncultured Caudovirales phage]CAB4185306.1 hypothetical protein UFOVP1125_16 [uncultured Caudovirales phage]